MRKTSGVPSVCASSMKLHPRRMMAEDVADHELLRRCAARRRRRARASATVSASGFSTKTCAPASIALDRVVGVGVGQVLIETTSGFSLGQRLVEVGEALRAGERLRQLALGDAALADADDLEAVDARIGERMAHAHVAEPDDENSFRGAHARVSFDCTDQCTTSSTPSIQVCEPSALRRAGRGSPGSRRDPSEPVTEPQKRRGRSEAMRKHLEGKHRDCRSCCAPPSPCRDRSRRACRPRSSAGRSAGRPSGPES